MSKSFSIDLKHYALTRTIGLGEKILRRPVDTYDVIQTLNDLGYNHLDEQGGVATGGFGLIPDLEATLQSATLGVPTNARVNMRRMGNRKNLLLITFTF